MRIHLQRSLTYLALTAMLSSCVAAFVAGAATGGIVVYDRRNIKQVSADNKIRHDLYNHYIKHPDYQGSHIVVSSFNHNVLLAGQTPHASTRVKAEKMARKQPGVRRIYNEIQVGAPTSSLTRSSDAWITTKIKTQMLTQQGLFKTGQVKVVTENSIVYLMGHVNQKQARAAAEIARRVTGVQRVVKVFDYKK